MSYFNRNKCVETGERRDEVVEIPGTGLNIF